MPSDVLRPKVFRYAKFDIGALCRLASQCRGGFLAATECWHHRKADKRSSGLEAYVLLGVDFDKMPDSKTASEELVEISRLGLESFTPADAIITDVKHLASYNWIEASTPTIAVAGSPAQWSAPQGPRHVKKDSGLVYIAQNAARHPDSPLELLFRSLYIEHPSFDMNSIDVVTDRNNIRKLLSFIKPTLTKNDLDPFTIMIAQTAIFCRDETATYEVIGPGEFRGFGREFEKAYTIFWNG
ncbi:hypothetical protein FQN54_008101 [Arachnomyces sp. PD_36]|nr:hypothetical protein FQN54_008101 [Arachnomyces sp. PD_36]